MPIVVNPNTTPLFTQLGPYCQGATPDAFPTTSNNGIAGSWSPATISTASPGSTPYTFTPTSAAPATCATIANMSISVTTLPLATIAGGGVTVCENGAQPNITFTGSNSTPPYTFTYTINGGANQTITTAGTSSTVTLPTPTSTTGAFTYELTSVAVGSCSNPISNNNTATITVSPNITPTFNQVGPYCNGQSIPALSTTSTNNIVGTWAPAINNIAISGAVTTNYTFTPTSGPGICATTANMPIVVNPNTTPLFTQLGPYCQGATPDAFPTTSNNGIAGSWSPATISTASPGSTPYTFTPTSAAPATCATIANMSIAVTVLPIATIGGSTSLCQNATPPSITFTGSNSTSPYTFTYTMNGGTPQTITTSNINSTVTIPVPTSNPGTYTFTLNSVTVGNCSNPINTNNTAIITVFENPTIVMPDQTICGGNPITINPNVTPSGGQYLWTGPLVNNLTSNSITVSPANNSTYSLNYTLNGCSTNQSVTITVIQNPTATVLNDTICFGDTVVLVGGPNGASYSWTGNNIIGPTNQQQIQVNPISTTTYTLSTQIGGCAVSTATATVTVNPIPTVDVSPETQNICNGQVATISSTVSPGGGTYQWQGSTVNGQSTGAISVNPVLVNPTASQTFQYILSYSINGCTGIKDTVDVVVKPKPVISVNDLTFCSGTFDSIEANPNIIGGTYYWSTGLSGNTDTLLIVSPLTNPIDQITNYYYDAWYILNGCSSDTVVSHVTVNPIPTITVNDATICAGNSATLTANPSSTGGTFVWTGPTITGSPLTTQSITVSPALTDPVLSQNFVYNVAYTDLGCTSLSVPANVTVNPTPLIQPINEIICSGGSFDTIPNPAAFGNIIPAGTTYTWTYADNPDILNEANNSISSTTISGGPLTSNVNVSTAVNYTVTPTSGTAGNCVGTPFNLNVTITATPTIANKIEAICSGSFPVVSFIPTDVVPPGTQYSWEILFDNPLISGQFNQTTFVGDFSNQILLNNDPLAQAQTLTYFVTPSSGPCAGSTFQFQVTVLPAPILADNNITICSDDNITNYTFGTPGDIIPTGTQYTWVVVPNNVVTGEQSNAIPTATFINAILHNTTNVDQTVHYVVTPIASALNPPCVGQSFDLYVIVKPTPVLQNVTLSPICSGTSFSYSPTDASPTTIWPINGAFTWTVATNVNVSGQSDNSGTPLSTLSQTLTNLTNVVQNVIYTISPIDTLSGCNGANYTVTVPVNPRPQIPNQLLSICSGLSFTFNPSNAAPAVIVPIGTTYTWPTPIDNPLGSISGESAGNNQPIISQTLTNINSIICDTMFYTVTPSVGTAPGLVCVGNPFVLAVSVKPVPAVTVQTPSTLICPNTCIQLTATPSHPIDCNGNQGTYSWSPAATLTPTPPNTAVVTACPAGNTTYNVTYNLDGCTANASVSINVVNPPNVGTISALEQTICEGGCTVLTANIQNQNIVPEYVEWSTGEIDYTSPFTIVVCPTDTLTYAATAYLAGCFGNSASTTVNVNYDPVITTQPNADTTICVGGTYPLSVNLQFGAGTANYQWYISNNGSNIGGAMIPGASGTVVTNTSGYSVLFSPQIFNTPGTYTYYCIITYGPNGCGSLTTAVANIHVIADPIVSILPNTTQNLCVGGTTTCLNTSVSGGIGTNYYLWNPGGASTSTFCPPSDSSGTFNYSVTVSQSGIACASLPSNVVVINIVPDPIITISGEIEVCDGAEVPLTTSVTGGIGNITSYTWNQSQPVGSPYSLMSWTSAGGTTVPLFDDITYQVQITQEGNGCNAIDTHYIHVVPDPIVTVDFEELVCVNTPTVLTANITGGTGIAYFDWYQVDSLLTVGGTPIPTDGPSDNSITQTIYESYYNFYYVALEMTGLGCDLDTSELVIIEALDWAIANFDVLPDSLEQSFLDPTFSFLNQSEHATNYWWDLDECAPQLPNSSLYQIPTSYYNPTSENVIDYTYGCEPGIYTVQLIAYNQGICPDTAWQQIAIRDVLIVYVPNTFTPNGDGINDIFIPVITHYDELAYYSFEIYDRWGEVIFSTDNSEQGWDGIAGRPWPFMEGTQSPPNKLDQSPQDGTYTWTLKARLKNSSDFINERGHVNILR